MNATSPLDRISSVLPLTHRQRHTSAHLADVHRSVLRSFAATGRPGDVDPADATALAALDLLVVDGAGAITGAYPFTLEPTDHMVHLPTARVGAMCSLDAVAIAPVFGIPTRIESRCAATGTPILIEQDPEGLRGVSPEAPWLGIRWQQTHGCAARSLCREMSFFAGEQVARSWHTGETDASVFSLEEGIAYGAAFFGPLLGESGSPQA